MGHRRGVRRRHGDHARCRHSDLPRTRLLIWIGQRAGISRSVVQTNLWPIRMDVILTPPVTWKINRSCCCCDLDRIGVLAWWSHHFVDPV